MSTEFPLYSNYKIQELSVFSYILISKKYSSWLGAMAHACNTSTLGGQGGKTMKPRDQDHPGQHDKTLSLLKIQKLAGHGGVCL